MRLVDLVARPSSFVAEYRDRGFRTSLKTLAPELLVLAAMIIGLTFRVLPSRIFILGGDELFKLRGAQDYLEGRLYADIDHPAVLKHLIAISITLFGTSEFTVRLPNILLSVATIGLVYGIGGRIAGRWIGVTAAWMLALNPFHIGYSHYMKEDAALSFFLTLALWVYLRDGDLGMDPRRRMNRMWFMCGLCAAVKFSGAVFPFVFLVHAHLCGVMPSLFTDWKKSLIEIWAGFRWAGLAFTIFSPWSMVYLPYFIWGGLGHWADQQVKGHDRRLLGQAYDDTPFWFYGPLFAFLVPIILVTLVLMGLVYLREKNFRGTATVPLLWWGMPLLFYSVLSFASKHYAVIFMAPLSLFAALSLHHTVKLGQGQDRLRPLVTLGVPALVLGLLLGSALGAHPFYRSYHNGLYNDAEFEQVYSSNIERIADLEVVHEMQGLVSNGDVIVSDMTAYQIDHYFDTGFVRWESVDLRPGRNMPQRSDGVTIRWSAGFRRSPRRQRWSPSTSDSV